MCFPRMLFSRLADWATCFFPPDSNVPMVSETGGRHVSICFFFCLSFSFFPPKRLPGKPEFVLTLRFFNNDIRFDLATRSFFPQNFSLAAEHLEDPVAFEVPCRCLFRLQRIPFPPPVQDLLSHSARPWGPCFCNAVKRVFDPLPKCFVPLV